MPGFDPNSLLPSGLVVDAVEVGPELISITAHPAQTFGVCPTCGLRSDRTHSLHRRRLLDLPSHGRSVELLVRARRFRCSTADCPRRTFTQPPLPEMAGRRGRRTLRLDGLVEALGVALGGRPGAALARRLMLPVGKDTLLRAVRRRTVPATGPSAVIGIDEWAWRRRQRYGTLICDLERRRVLDLLPDREPTTVRAWLASHPDITIVARDRAGGFAGAADAAAPSAIQVADRWHLMENASAAFLGAVRSVLGPIRRALGACTIDPELLSAAERLQYDVYLRRCEESRTIRAMARDGTSIKGIVRRTGRSRKLVRAVLRNTEDEVFRSRANSLEPWLASLEAAWAGGCRNGAELWRRLRVQGFGGSLRVVGEWATRRRRSERADGAIASRLPPARTIVRTMLSGRDRLSRSEAVMVGAIERALPALATARDLVDRFHRMVRTRASDALPAWVSEATTSMLAPFGRGIAADKAAVSAALTTPWSNGPTEGYITKLKLIRRQMYGCGKLDLLRARLVTIP
ncbi:ISL3 family transposase [Roseomonas chloroacetimidivorans]|uniref:ISL3 family transposase n=1 Tax=Roseomonas chloroacetimidivorans TaxID=1766656 RepID=UPI003C7500B7